jgi:release factor glutamine methyltransferase
LAGFLQSATARLQQALGLDRREARLEAQILSAHALGVERSWLIAHDRDVLTTAQAKEIEILMVRREVGEPVAYILGEKEFYGRMFKVNTDVLIPRAETELLVEAALARLPKDRPTRILDLGTGSGCIAITLALVCPRCIVSAVDRSPAALAIAQGNAATLGARVEFRASNWFGDLLGEAFDIIVANPPYVPASAKELTEGDVRYEPRSALTAGDAGLDDLTHIAREAPRHFLPGGWLMVEHGWNQGEACRNLFGSQGFVDVLTLGDLAGHDRVTLGRQPK